MRVESYIIPKMNHGTAIDPGFEPAGGCGTAGAYLLDVNICSTYYAARFFGLDTTGTPPPPSDGGALVDDAGAAPSDGGGTFTWPGFGSFPSSGTKCGPQTCLVGNCCTTMNTCGYKVGLTCLPSY